jgi:hypothetical protein
MAAGRSIKRAVALMLSGVAAVLNAAAPVSLLLEPATDWTFTDQAGACDASRTFGSGAQTIVASLRKYGPTRKFQLRAVGKPLLLQKLSHSMAASLNDGITFFLGSALPKRVHSPTDCLSHGMRLFPRFAAGTTSRSAEVAQVRL